MHSIVVCVLVFLSVQGRAENNEMLQFGNLIKELQAEMVEMRKVRQEDSETIRNLQEKIHRYVTSDSSSPEITTSGVFEDGSGTDSFRNGDVTSLDSSLPQNSNTELSLLARQFKSFKSFVMASEDSKPALKTEAEFLRQELGRLSKQIEDIKVQNSEDIKASSSRVTVRWLQRTVEGIRREMREIASAVNTSAVLAEKQKTMTNFALLRSDVVALGHRMDTVRVDQERNTAVLKQLRQDMEEMRQRLQESAMGQQRLIIEVSF